MSGRGRGDGRVRGGERDASSRGTVANGYRAFKGKNAEAVKTAKGFAEKTRDGEKPGASADVVWSRQAFSVSKKIERPPSRPGRPGRSDKGKGDVQEKGYPSHARSGNRGPCPARWRAEPGAGAGDPRRRVDPRQRVERLLALGYHFPEGENFHLPSDCGRNREKIPSAVRQRPERKSL